MKTILALTLFLLSHAFAAPFIIGGSKATMIEFPWQVSLQNNDGHFCGGSIISKRLILTAAHCLVVPNIKVYGGGDGSEWKMKKLGMVKNIRIHENWLRTRKFNDIGLIELNEDIVFGDDIHAIELATEKDFKVGAKVLLSGLGVIVDPNISGEIKYPSFLQKVELTLAPKLNDYKFWSKQISTYYAEKYDEYGLSAIADVPNKRFNDRKGGCYADSGGPLVIQASDKTYRLLGVVSKLIEGCGVSTIFTYVPSHQNWIHQQLSLSTY